MLQGMAMGNSSDEIRIHGHQTGQRLRAHDVVPCFQTTTDTYVPQIYDMEITVYLVSGRFQYYLTTQGSLRLRQGKWSFGIFPPSAELVTQATLVAKVS